MDAEGNWHVGGKVLDERMRGFLLQNLEFDAELVRYRVRYPMETHNETRYLHHESPPLRVRALHFDPGGCSVGLNDGSREPLRPETLRLDAQERLFCAVRAEGLPAWFSDGSRFSLLDRAEETLDGRVLHLPGHPAPHPLCLDASWPGADHLPK